MFVCVPITYVPESLIIQRLIIAIFTFSFRCGGCVYVCVYACVYVCFRDYVFVCVCTLYVCAYMRISACMCTDTYARDFVRACISLGKIESVKKSRITSIWNLTTPQIPWQSGWGSNQSVQEMYALFISTRVFRNSSCLSLVIDLFIYFLFAYWQKKKSCGLTFSLYFIF